MNAEDARTLMAYNHWANRRVLAAARELPPPEFTQDLHANFGSVKGTLVHILGGEWHWLRFWQGQAAQELPTPDDFPDANALSAAFIPLEQEESRFVEGLTDDHLATPMTVRASAYPLAQLIQHFANHSTYHRGQISTLLRQLGRKPPATDFRVFLDDSRSVAPSGSA